MAYTTTAKEFIEGDLRRALAAGALQGARGLVELDIEDSGAWLVDLATNEVKATQRGAAKPVACIVRARERDFMALVEGRMSPSDGLLTERLHVAGDAATIGKLWAALSGAARG